jgi:hypothetical protein
MLAVGCLPSETAERSVSLPAAGVMSVRIIAEAGSLKVQGQSGIAEVSITGTAYARNIRDLEKLQIVTRTDGTEIIIETETSPGGSRFDITVEIPDSFQVKIDDSSGFIEVQNVAGVRLTDSSGDINISDVSGDVTVDDDGSGSIEIQNVIGQVDIIEDSSGSIVVTNIDGNFHVGNDGSGNIIARDIRGDFTVDHDGSGSITHFNIEGKVEIQS